MSLWSGSTDSRILDYQRTNLRECQIVRTHLKKPLECKALYHPTTSSTLCRMPHPNNKQNKNTNPIISRQDYHLTQPCPSEEKQTNKQNLSTNLTLYEVYTNHWANLRRAENKRQKEFKLFQRKNSTFLEDWEKETSTTISLKKNEKVEKYYTNEGTN